MAAVPRNPKLSSYQFIILFLLRQFFVMYTQYRYVKSGYSETWFSTYGLAS